MMSEEVLREAVETINPVSPIVADEVANADALRSLLFGRFHFAYL